MTPVIHRFTTKFFLILVLLGIAVVPASAALLPPVTNPNIIPDGNTNFFFWNGSSNVNGYANRFATYPQLQDNVVLSTTVSSTQEVTLGNFITDPFPLGASMSPGLTEYTFWGSVSASSGVCTFSLRPYIHHANGTDESMFYGVPRTIDIDPNTPMPQTISYARRNYTIFEPGSSLLIKVNVSTTSGSKTVTMNVSGTSFATRAQIGYWQLAPSIDVDTPSAVSGDSITVGVIGGFIGGAGAIMYWRRRNKK